MPKLPLKYKIHLKGMQGRGKIVHWEKAAAAKPKNLSWSHMVGERRRPEPTSGPMTSTVADAHAHQHTHARL